MDKKHCDQLCPPRISHHFYCFRSYIHPCRANSNNNKNSKNNHDNVDSINDLVIIHVNVPFCITQRNTLWFSHQETKSVCVMKYGLDALTCLAPPIISQPVGGPTDLTGALRTCYRKYYSSSRFMNGIVEKQTRNGTELGRRDNWTLGGWPVLFATC